MKWTEWLFWAIILALVMVAGTFAERIVELGYRRRRCHKCDRAWALKRVLGERRSGYVRFRCKYCGAKRWKVIEDDDFAP